MAETLSARVRHAERVMGTVVSFDVPASATADGSLESAIRWLHWVDRVFSPYRPDSDISRLARAEVAVGDCAPEVGQVLAACAGLEEESGGYFTSSPGGRLDPSGYVKGWAAERAASRLTEAGSAAHLVNAGGDVRCVGAGPHAGNWRVGIAAPPVSGGFTSGQPVSAGGSVSGPPASGGLAFVVAGREFAVATSGTAERGAHIVDPVAGRPATGLASITVAGPSLTRADACATAAFAMGPDLAREWTESLDGYEAFAILPDGATWRTRDFSAYLAGD
ncbi:MAG: FAD:protein FMN transferase [Nocardiopsaceae bacterium]|nr:FAD:protein FMN transferase [Nocardiopsaceae bacterium]